MYKVKIKIDTDSDFILKFEHPNTEYKYKCLGGRIRATLYYNKLEEQTIKDLINFLRSLHMDTQKEGLKYSFDASIYQYTEDLERMGLHSNHNLMSGNYEMQVSVFNIESQYL